jgi:uncharacterized DUF497 family protein
VEFEWCDAESSRNLARYGVRFSEAVHVFLDPKAIEFGDQRQSALSMIGRTPRGLLYVVFTDTTEGRVRILHARLADSAPSGVEPEFEFDQRRMKRVARPDRHFATATDVSPRRCKVSVTLELDAEVAAAFRNKSVNQVLRDALGRTEPVRLVGDDTLMREISRRSGDQLQA